MNNFTEKFNLGSKTLYPNLEKLRIYCNRSAHSNFKIMYSKKWEEIKIKIWDNSGKYSVNFKELLLDLFKIKQFFITLSIIFAINNFILENDGKNPLEIEIEELKKNRK